MFFNNYYQLNYLGWGSGTTTYPSYIISPYEGIKNRAGKKTKITATASNWNLDKAEKVAKASDIAIVFANSDSGEQYITVDGNIGDRNNLTLWNNGDKLVKINKILIIFFLKKK